MIIRLCACVALLAAAASCGLPRDVEGTLERVRGGTLRVGVVANEPWVEGGAADPHGLEVDLVELLAERVDADIEWTAGTAEEVLGALELHSLDLAIGGFAADDPWGSQVTFTIPYATTTLLVGAPRRSDIPADIAGERVGVEQGSEAEALLEKTDARPKLVEDPTEHEGLVVVEDYLLEDLSLVDTRVHLTATEHVMAVPHGENAWLVEVENFLLDERDTARRMIEAVEP